MVRGGVSRPGHHIVAGTILVNIIKQGPVHQDALQITLTLYVVIMGMIVFIPELVIVGVPFALLGIQMQSDLALQVPGRRLKTAQQSRLWILVTQETTRLIMVHA